MESSAKKWCSIWGNAISITENRPAGYGKDITLRYPVCCPFGGEKLRLTFDNYTGREAVTLTEVTVLYEGTFYEVTWEGAAQVTLPAGGRRVSDEIAADFRAGSTFYVSFYLGDFTSLRCGVYTQGPLSNGAKYAVGNQTHTEEIDIEISRSNNIVYFFSNASLYTSAENRALICYGDSITAQDWPDYLQRKVMGVNPADNHVSIVRRAASGTRILREYSCITYESYGLMGKNRFDHEVPTDGADTVLIQQGINDIIHPVGTDVNPFRPMSDLPTVQELIDGYKWYIERARSYGYKVYGGTLLPIEGWRTYALFREEMRNAFNDFLRSTDLLDGCVDFDAAVRDAGNPAAFAKVCDSGDHLHPSKEGYRLMAEAVPTELLGKA